MGMRMPALFVGHGSPMNAIEDNAFTAAWEEIGARLPRPEAILSVSAHWFTAGTRVSDAPRPRMVYDMYGFPEELYRVVYPAPGSPALARRTAALPGLEGLVRIDDAWGLDHGTWSVLRRMLPAADVPVFQMSVDRNAPPEEHLRIGRAIGALRDEGVLVLGSGNVVHDLGRVGWDMEGGYPWADAFDAWVRDRVAAGDFTGVARYREAGSAAALAVPTTDHFDPLLAVLGAARPDDRLTVFNDARTLGSLSMTGYLFEAQVGPDRRSAALLREPPFVG